MMERKEYATKEERDAAVDAIMDTMLNNACDATPDEGEPRGYEGTNHSPTTSEPRCKPSDRASP